MAVIWCITHCPYYFLFQYSERIRMDIILTPHNKIPYRRWGYASEKYIVLSVDIGTNLFILLIA